MATQSTQCEKAKGIDKSHKFVTDPEDKRFKVCARCGETEYRSDDDVMKGK